jgi:hypothetical protein
MNSHRTSNTFNLITSEIEDTNVIDPCKTKSDVDFELVNKTIHFTLNKLYSEDPKFNFSIRNLSTIDSENLSIRQYYYFLIWKDLSRPNVCRLVNDDGYFSSVELVKCPKKWSKYDLDAHIIKINKRHILNGLSLRDDLLKSLMIILKSRDEKNEKLKFTHFEFETSLIRLYFEARFKKSLPPTDPPPKTIPEYKVTYIISLTPILSFTNATPLIINSMKEQLKHHNFFENYFDSFSDKRFYLLTFNSYKWAYDVVYSEHKLFQYILKENSSSFIPHAYKRLMTIKQSWRKYFDKSYQAVENAKLLERQCLQSAKENTQKSKITQKSSRAATSYRRTDFALSSQFEIALERTITEYLFRVLFLRECSRLGNLPHDREEFNKIIITNVLEQLLNSFEKKYCESFSLKYKNVIPKLTLQFETCINIGISKLIKEIILDWKRGKFGY